MAKSKNFCFAWYYDGEHDNLSNSHKHSNKSQKEQEDQMEFKIQPEETQNMFS